MECDLEMISSSNILKTVVLVQQPQDNLGLVKK